MVYTYFTSFHNYSIWHHCILWSIWLLLLTNVSCKWFAYSPISVYLFLFFFYTESGVTSSNLLRGNISSDESQSHFEFWGKGRGMFLEKGPWPWNSSPWPLPEAETAGLRATEEYPSVFSGSALGERCERSSAKSLETGEDFWDMFIV